jgi:ketol-acid reductoisomerase
MTKLYSDKDANIKPLKDKTIAIIGYGSQGHAHAQNLRESGLKVIVGQRKGSPNYNLAVKHGFKPVTAAQATQKGDLIAILMPDEVQGDVYKAEVEKR